MDIVGLEPQQPVELADRNLEIARAQFQHSGEQDRAGHIAHRLLVAIQDAPGEPVAPGPRGHDGVDPPVDAAAGKHSLDLVEAMIAGLMRFDGQNLSSMAMRDFWSDDFWWFGPGPIGNFCGHAAYEAGHQGPFLRAFPDRIGGNHRARIGHGRFVASTGWPSINATHSGGDWLGLPATGRRVTMRVMDFWARDGDRLDENWVMIDIPDLLLQVGVDMFARMAVLAGNRG